MKRFYAALAMIIITIGLSQCQRDLSYIGGPDPGAPFIPAAEPVKASLQGNIVDESGQPSAGVVVTVGSQSATSNASGYFRINDASLDKTSSLVTAEKAGYFKSYRVFGAGSGTNQVLIKLVRKALAGTIPAGAGGTATLANGAKISLPANGVVDATNGAAYTGDVRVFAAYIDPTNTDIAQTVPGSFMADDKTGGRVMLTSYGMLAVELESPAAVKLQVKQGSAATLTMPIPASLTGSATPTIPLWYVNEITGIWQEEGLATKQGNLYVGEVKHFTYWNCDVPGKAVNISLTLKSTAGGPLVHASVRFRPEGGMGGAAHGFTDSLGQIRGLVPAGRTLTMEVLDACSGVAYSQVIPPLNIPTELGTITVSGTSQSVVTFQGKIVDCSNAPVKNGYAMITFNNALRYAKTNGNGEFSVVFVSCSAATSTAQVIAVNNDTQQQGASSAINVTAPSTNAGTLTACGTSSVQFINYTIDGVDYKINSTTSDSLYAFNNAQNGLNIFGSQRTNVVANISFVTRNVTSATTYPVAEMQVQNYRRVVLKTPFNVVFTNYAAAAGQFYEGTLSGQFTADSSTAVHSLNGSFKVRRN